MINKKYWDGNFKEWFKLPDRTVLFYYRNPSDCTSFNCEMVNPTHKGYILGKPKNKTNYIKIGRVYISNIITFFSNEINQLFNLFLPNLNISIYLYNIFLSTILLAFLLNIRPLEMHINNLRC